MLPIPGSASVVNPKLNLFSVPATDTSILNRRYIPVSPFTTGITPVDLCIEPQSGYCDLSRSFLEVDFTPKKADGTDLTGSNTTTIFPTTNLAHSMIKQMNIRLGDTLISPQTDTYSYQAFIEKVCNFDRTDGEDILAPEGWYNGLNPPNALTADQMNHRTPHADYSALSDETKAWLKGARRESSQLVGKTRPFRFKPHNEIFNLSKLMVPQVPIQIQIFFNNPNFWMVRYHGTEAVRLTLDDIKVKFVLCVVTLNPSIERELAVKQTKSVVSYPTVRGEVRTYNLRADVRHFEINDPGNGRIPNVLIVGMVESAAFNGDYTKHPFAFQKVNLANIQQFVRGEAYPYQLLELKHDGTDKDILGYFRFLEATGCFSKGKGNMLLPHEWGQGKNCTLFAFDNTANGFLHSSMLNPKLSGELRLVLNFGANPGENITVIVYSEYEGLLEIDSNRTVYYNVYDTPGLADAAQNRG